MSEEHQQQPTERSSPSPRPPSPAPHPLAPLFSRILSHLSPEDPASVRTLLSASLVSKAFAAAASPLWTAHLAFHWPRPALLNWVALPSTCDPADQKRLNELYGRAGGQRDAKVEFRLRWQLDDLAAEHLRRLIECPCDKLRSFDLLCALGKQVWERVLSRPTEWTRREGQGSDAEGSEGSVAGQDDLCALYWAREVKFSMERREAALAWMKIDQGQFSVGESDLRELGWLAFAPFAGGTIDEAFQLLAKFFDRIRDRVLPQIQPAVDELEALPSTSDESLVRSKLLAFGDKLFRTLRSELSRLELKPSPAESADDKRLDSCFLLLVDQDRIERLFLLREWTTLTLELTERGAFLDEIASVSSTLNPTRDTLPPTANLSIYTHLLVALARRFPPAHRLILHPIMEKHVLRATMSWKCTEGEDGTVLREVRGDCLFDALGGESVLCPEGEEEPAALQRLTPFCSIRRFASDICASLASRSSSSSSRVTPESARYAQLLVPSVISKPYTGPDAFIRLSAAAVKLAEHIGRHFPFDVCLLEQIVLPRVEGVYGQGVIKGVVQRAKAVDRVRVTPKGRMDGDGPRGMVGQLVLSKRQNMLGIIVGWDHVFSAQSCWESHESETDAAPERLLLGKLQAFYTVIWAYRNAKEGSLSYVAEEDLTLQPACGDGDQEEEFEGLTQMHDVGRWFGTWEVPETGVDEFRFVPSAELRALYPDD